ncbi:MAG: hypothetical protein Q7T45_13480 [Bradyrhizobium sp.]|uniref:hypothetical protein n=1 Tax=Bradyrhizobium sp. TaxID=376 RepID=UPI002728C985|nr:hypothetical protein [Bradyrhizobium sp.]MDO8398824.1 hypothetical protein [Bradyrhizobium sp.]
MSLRKNVAIRATDLDTKDEKIESERITKTSYAETFLLNLESRNWMKLAGFAQFLNRMGQTRAKYGGVLVKKTEADGGARHPCRREAHLHRFSRSHLNRLKMHSYFLAGAWLQTVSSSSLGENPSFAAKALPPRVTG